MAEFCILNDGEQQERLMVFINQIAFSQTSMMQSLDTMNVTLTNLESKLQQPLHAIGHRKHLLPLPVIPPPPPTPLDLRQYCSPSATTSDLADATLCPLSHLYPRIPPLKLASPPSNSQTSILLSDSLVHLDLARGKFSNSDSSIAKNPECCDFTYPKHQEIDEQHSFAITIGVERFFILQPLEKFPNSAVKGKRSSDAADPKLDSPIYINVTSDPLGENFNHHHPSKAEIKSTQLKAITHKWPDLQPINPNNYTIKDANPINVGNLSAALPANHQPSTTEEVQTLGIGSDGLNGNDNLYLWPCFSSETTTTVSNCDVEMDGMGPLLVLTSLSLSLSLCNWNETIKRCDICYEENKSGNGYSSISTAGTP